MKKTIKQECGAYEAPTMLAVEVRVQQCIATSNEKFSEEEQNW